MTLDRTIALFFLLFCGLYGFASFDYPLLPFERNMVFLPNTMPTALSVIGIGLSLILLISGGKPQTAEAQAEQDRKFAALKEYKLGQAALIVGAMVLYALVLRPIGFIPSTIAFLVGCSWVLGERKIIKMVSVSAIGTVGIWYLVQEVLGIFLRPLPAFIG
ncbi:tripartite tricarboxylate transporter TctB family protein [Kiloniella sp. b19]|uniref:tripartite tricarboxylate transporter TctB family protein n=1 Tax=Kiloniella sp. GXU_MW_B19 TaxID=3141326 RepID=UPI0031E1D8AA